MTPLLWTAIAAAAIVALWIFLRIAGRSARLRAGVLEDVRRALRGGVIDTLPGRGPQARGRLGELEITVDLYSDPARPKQSPMWRVLAVGPVRIERPMEVRVAGWQGWIDPWLQLGETVTVPAHAGPELTVHSEHGVGIDHPVVAAVRRQGGGLTAGALHARPDLMRAEVRCAPRIEANRPLFSFLHAMGEISELPAHRAGESARSSLRGRRKGVTTHEVR
jgi:hypothetical protein